MNITNIKTTYGYIGFIPFAFFSLLPWIIGGEPAKTLIIFQLGYGSIIITFLAIIYIFYDSLKLGNFYGDILGFITAIGLAVGAVTIRSAKSKNLVPAAVVGKLLVATFALFFINFGKIEFIA